MLTPETVEVVDRYAETPPHDDQDQVEDAATHGPNGAARPEGLGPAPCPDWSHGIEHPAHEWDAPVDGRVSCPGWTPPADPTLEADRADPEVTQLVARWPKLATRAERGGDVTTSAHTGPFIQVGEAPGVDPFKVADELRFHLGKGRAPGQPTARQVIASTLQNDWFFAGVSGHVGRLADEVLAALDEHGLGITRRGDTDPGNAARPTAIGYGQEHIEPIARAFHDTYERLAPEHDYTTREASAVPWAEVPANNKSLMIAVVASLIAEGRIIPGEA